MSAPVADAETRAERRERVVRCYIDRCRDAGLVKGRGKTDEAALIRLSDWLGYLSDDNLATLAETTIDQAGGPLGRDWPAEATIRHWAKSLQRPPVVQHRIVTSWLASIEGPPAVAGGYEVELYRLLCRIAPRPPGPFDMQLVRDEARDNASTVLRVSENIAAGRAAPDDRQWLEAYLRTREHVRQIITEGAARRATQERDRA